MGMALDPGNQSIADSPCPREAALPCCVDSGGSHYLQQRVAHLDVRAPEGEQGLLLPLLLLLNTRDPSPHLVNKQAQLLQDAGLNRLEEMQVESGFSRLALGVDISVAADCDKNRRLGYNETLDPPGRLVAVHAGHSQVQHGYVRSEGSDRGNGLRPT